MSTFALPLRRQRAADLLARRRSRLEQLRIELPGDAATTLHVARYDLEAFRLRVVRLPEVAPLVRFCRQQEISDAVVGGFFIRSRSEPLGALQMAGVPQPSTPFDSPWDKVRACLHIDGSGLRIACRDQLPAHCDGDLLQAGPMLVRGGRNLIRQGEDREGFSAGARQFDSDITAGRYPRAALGLAGDRLLTVACDGRTPHDAGMTLGELARTMIGLGASEAINLDGGGSASLIYAGHLRNRPREEHGIDLLEGRPILTAVAIEPR